MLKTHVNTLAQRTIQVNISESIQILSRRYHKYEAAADLEDMITLILECQPPGHFELSLFISAENEITEVIDKPRTEVDLDIAIRLGRGLLAARIPGHPRRSESLRKFINLLAERFKQQDAISVLDELVMLHRDILEFHPPGDNARPSLLHDSAHFLWCRFQRRGRTCDLEEAIAFEKAALQLHLHGHAEHVTSFRNVVRYHDELRKAGNATDVGELIALGRTGAWSVGPC